MRLLSRPRARASACVRRWWRSRSEHAMRALAAALVVAIAVLGCSTLRPVTAGSGDLADYRAFRVAAAPGTRLARAKKYLDAHPTGAFVEEVRAAWDDEEPRYFERAQA